MVQLAENLLGCQNCWQLGFASASQLHIWTPGFWSPRECDSISPFWFGQALLSKVTWASCHFRKMADAIGFEAVNYGSGFKLTPCSSRQNSILAILVIQFLNPMSLWSRAELVSIFFVYMSNFYCLTVLLHHRMNVFVTQIGFKHFQESKG